MAAASAAWFPGKGEFNRLVAALDPLEGQAEGRRVVAGELTSCFTEALAAAWARGWQPADFARVAERRAGASHARYAVDVIALEASISARERTNDRWAGQLRSLGAHIWWDPRSCHLDQWAAREGTTRRAALVCALELLGLLLRLPSLPHLCSSPDEPGSGARSGPGAPNRRPRDDGRMLARVRALLAKAESTTFAEEADALSAKAQELMAKHAIDAAMVDSADGSRHQPIGVRMAVDDPYAAAKSMLLAQVASTNACRAVWSKDLGFSTVLGFETDVEFVEVLYTSLLVQASSAMVAAGAQIDRYGRSRTRSFRQSFLVAYASRIGERLRAAEAASQAAAAREYGQALLPVLADRSATVDSACDTMFPAVGTHSLSTTNRAGWSAGSAAADLSTLSVRPQVRPATA